MFLAPRQLQRAGMTGHVPYYGGRLTPWQIQGINETAKRRPPPPPPSAPAPLGTTVPVLPAPAADPAHALAALGQLLDSGVISAQEYATLRERVVR